MENINQEYKYFVGIDFGTDYTSCCYAVRGSAKIEVIKNWPRQAITQNKFPSAIAYTDSGIKFGNQPNVPNVIGNLPGKLLTREGIKDCTEFLKLVNAHVLKRIYMQQREVVNQEEVQYCFTLEHAGEPYKENLRAALEQAEILKDKDRKDKTLFIDWYLALSMGLCQSKNLKNNFVIFDVSSKHARLKSVQLLEKEGNIVLIKSGDSITCSVPSNDKIDEIIESAVNFYESESAIHVVLRGEMLRSSSLLDKMKNALLEKLSDEIIPPSDAYLDMLDDTIKSLPSKLKNAMEVELSRRLKKMDEELVKDIDEELLKDEDENSDKESDEESDEEYGEESAEESDEEESEETIRIEGIKKKFTNLRKNLDEELGGQLDKKLEEWKLFDELLENFLQHLKEKLKSLDQNLDDLKEKVNERISLQEEMHNECLTNFREEMKTSLVNAVYEKLNTKYIGLQEKFEEWSSEPNAEFDEKMKELDEVLKEHALVISEEIKDMWNNKLDEILKSLDEIKAGLQEAWNENLSELQDELKNEPKRELWNEKLKGLMEIIEATQEPEQVPEEPEQVPEEPEQVSEKSKEQLKEIWKNDHLKSHQYEYYEKTCAVVKNVEQEFEKNVRANLKKEDMIKELNQQLETLKEELKEGLGALTDEKSLAKNLIEEKRELFEKMKQEKTQKFYKDLDEEITKVLALHQSDWKKDLKKALTNTQKAYVIQQICINLNNDQLFAADSAVRQTEYSKYA